MSDKTRITLSTGGLKIAGMRLVNTKYPALVQKLSCRDRYALARRILNGDRLIVFAVDGERVSLQGLCERCLNMPGVNDGYAVDRPGEMLCNECLAELWSDNCLPSIYVQTEQREAVTA